MASREIQRLRQIKQLGMGYIVYPTAEHSRFTHALGAMALLSDAIESLELKGVNIDSDEKIAALAAILLHDIGHSPFSHTLEFKLIEETSHEEISLALIRRLKLHMDGPLDMVIQMLEGTYERPFFCDLISSQLDMDRLDYLRRDSHFTGVVEGNIGIDRILRILCVHPKEGGADSCLAIESKGVYAVENVLIARRLMYWQVYLHKTVIAADFVLCGAIRRARDLIALGDDVAVSGISPALHWFLKREINCTMLLDDEVLDHFLDLDDTEIICSLKKWCHSRDPILSDLSRRIMNRDLFRCTFLDEPPSQDLLPIWRERVTRALKKIGIKEPNAHTYYLIVNHSSHAAYEPDEGIVHVLDPRGNLINLDQYADSTSISALTNFVKKPYVCYLKSADLLD
ncbi:MAG: HD domain-containing protein [Bacteroidetes bacterium]|nr:HD domain-containing protein [Bacteroidota bacterium]MCY4205995.1 HD domain-containing protein [Bacteroidota bacterium]